MVVGAEADRPVTLRTSEGDLASVVARMRWREVLNSYSGLRPMSAPLQRAIHTRDHPSARAVETFVRRCADKA